MAEHNASVQVNAPVEQVYLLFSRFDEYPKFMKHVKEVRYLTVDRTHWVADLLGVHEWDAVNEDWIPNRQIGWRSTSGLQNEGRVLFSQEGPNHTRIDVRLSYDPPAGALGDLGEMLGAGGTFEEQMQHDLERFARLVEEGAPDALDPASPSYVFNPSNMARQDASSGNTRGRFDDAAMDRLDAASARVPQPGQAPRP